MNKITIINSSTNEVISSNCKVVKAFFSRAIGLMGQKEIAEDFCLLIEPCNQIHMMHMKFPIDVLYLDSDNRVIAIDDNIKPWSIGKKRNGAYKVVESNAGYLSKKVNINDCLVIKQVK